MSNAGQQASLPFGTLGIPVGVKPIPRADFNPNPFTVSIEGHGYRVAWTRAVLCPCRPLNDQTSQADPNCPQCHAKGYFYFGSTTPQDPDKIGLLNTAQQAIVTGQNAFVIRAILTSLSSDTSPFKDIGGWRTGTCNVTTRPENKLAYYDKLVAIDSTIAYNEVVVINDTNVLPVTYVVDGGVTLVMDDSFHRYAPDVDYTLLKGKIVWLRNQPRVGTRVAVHYMTHPTWIVMTYPHTVRNTYILGKKLAHSTPEGDYYDLPIQAQAKLEFLVNAEEST